MSRPTDDTMQTPREVEMAASSSSPCLSDMLGVDERRRRGACSAEPSKTVILSTKLTLQGCRAPDVDATDNQGKVHGVDDA